MFSHSDSEDEGVRVNIPLHHIRAQRYRVLADTFPILSLTVDSPLATSNDEDSHQVIDLATFKLTEECVKRLESLIRQARERAKEGSAAFIERPVVIDFGVVDKRSESKSSLEDMAKARTKEQVVCDILAIDNGPDVWGKPPKLS